MRPLDHLNPHQTNKNHTTRKQTEANRQNATHSTGPRTEEGRTTSSRNAMKHNLTGRFQLLRNEDKAAYAKFALAFIENLKPAGAMEEKLVESIIESEWRLLRIRMKEEAIFQAGGPDEMTKLAQLSRYEAAQHRIVTRSLIDLRIQQKERREQELEILATAFESQNKGCTFQPKNHMRHIRPFQFGFVLEKSRFAKVFINALGELANKDESASSEDRPAAESDTRCKAA